MALDQAIFALGILASTARMVPVIGGMLEGAAATASQICTIVKAGSTLILGTLRLRHLMQGVQSNRIAFEELATQSAQLAAEIVNVLQKADEETLAGAEANVKRLLECVLPRYYFSRS